MNPKKNKTKHRANKRLLAMVVIAALLLIVPLIAMQFTDQVNWHFADFAVMAILLFGVGLSCELVLRKFKKPIFRICLCVFLFIAFCLIWVELAVGIFGSPFAGS
ncbi:hypothetical protein O4H26_11895 [Aequorivita viscosa]|nr:hypothetical protein [Aequorivita viscosa]